MGRKLTLHIGTHKTGTSSIQAALYQNRGFLERNGLALFYLSANGFDRKDGHPGMWTKPFPNPLEGVSIDDGLARSLGELPGNVIMSQENFSWVTSLEELKRFKSELADYFDDIQIVVYLRRQDQLMVSHHQQASKGWRFMAARLFGDTPRALPEYGEGVRLYLDYFERLSRWADTFGDNNMTFRIFEKGSLTGEDAVLDFGEVIGLKFQNCPDYKNESNGFIRTKVGHLMNQIEYSNRDRAWVNSYLDNSGKLLPSREQAEQFYALFDESNIQLNRRFNISENPSIFSGDFSMYPDSEEDLWTEENANDAIRSLLCAYVHPKYTRSEDESLLNRLIVFFEKDQPEISHKLENIFSI